MGFQLEREMLPHVESWVSRRGMSGITEFSTPWGVCDLVAARLNGNSVKRRLRLGQRRAIGSASGLDILSKLPDIEDGRSRSLRTLRRAMEGLVDSDELNSQLRILIRNQLVREPRANHFQKLNGWAPLHSDLVTIELKLSRVSEAINQAIQNQQLTRQSYIAIPLERANSLRETHTNRMRDIGIGLLGVSRDSCRTIFLANSDRAPKPVASFESFAVEKFWGKYIKDSGS